MDSYTINSVLVFKQQLFATACFGSLLIRFSVIYIPVGQLNFSDTNRNTAFQCGYNFQV